MERIYIEKTNKSKLKEYEQMFNQLNIDIVSLYEKYPEAQDVEETGMSFKENAILKAEAYSEAFQINVLADDSGLVIDALNGEPGIYSARYAGPTARDEENIDKVLEKMKNVPDELRSAHFIAVLALAIPGEKTIFKTGICEGKITYAPKGKDGFGYDPIFIPSNYDQTMAELGDMVKNKISHRYRALLQLKQW